MLNSAPVAATIAVRDLDKAKKFYVEIVGLKIKRDLAPGAFICEAGAGSMILVYSRPNHVPSAATVASFEVTSAEDTVRDLEARGLRFEDYDLPEVKTDANHIATLPGGSKGAWFTDPDGNIIAVAQM